MTFSRNVASIDDYTLDDIYETLDEAMTAIDEVNTALVDIADIRSDAEIKALMDNLSDAWHNAFKMRNKIKKELN